MSVAEYAASGGRSATIRVDGDAMRIEAQRGGYGIGWATELGPGEIAHELAGVVPARSSGTGGRADGGRPRVPSHLDDALIGDRDAGGAGQTPLTTSISSWERCPDLGAQLTT